ncbi:MAG: T9SS type A sorting domain-containing protein [Bacteroidia bacterium]|nr:T9SS type A sorting domain-containing protein [Bacteroidia bacterium]
MGFYKRIFNIIILILALNVSGFSQEQLRPLSSNINLPVIKHQQQLSKTTSTLTPLNLPFFDDFSYAYYSPYPSVNNWIDSNVYVNTGFAIAPISLGVATFDGLNKKGYPYSINAPQSFSGGADTLKSRPINLHSTTTHTYSPADSIHISFYYQAEGNGEAPEPNDSLCLDFFKPRQNKWKKVWGVKGYNPSATDTNFYRVRVAIADTAYCDSLFQFRFRNKATTSGSLDHWNLDYVQIKQNYFYYDTILDDVSFVYKPSSFLKNYSVMPYRQFDSLERAPKFRNYIRNNFSTAKFSSYQYTVTDEFYSPIATDLYGTFDNPGIRPFLTDGYYAGNAALPVFTLQPLPKLTPNATFFTIKHVVSTPSDLRKDNDTLVHVQRFSDYYAYDDGSAELGYYLNTYGAKTAVRFTLNVIDTLKSVRIYFDPIIDGTTIQNSSFRLIVWDNGGSQPGSIIYKDSLMYPTYISGGYNIMPTYTLTSCLPLNIGTYYIGIQQTTNKGLNIGLDKNTNHMDALYYDNDGTWRQSAVPGSLMINPVMGCTSSVTVSIAEHEKNSKFKIFPNPAQNNVTISFAGNQIENVIAEFYNSLGEMVKSSSIMSNDNIDISNLSNGLYFIHLKGNNLNVSSQKLIICR